MNHNRMYNILKNDANKKIGLLEEIKSKPKLNSKLETTGVPWPTKP